jgi:DNA-binding transcriptional MerR regulator
MADELLRIGEISKRSGVSPELLRAWERRYGLLNPARSRGGLRLYTREDLERVRVMREHLASGFAAAEAAALASRALPTGELAERNLSPAGLRASLAHALDHLDEPRAQDVFDRALSLTTLDTLLGEIVLPYLRELGERWQAGEISVAQEHFASALVRGRLLGLARGWGLGVGPPAVLACLPGEQHDIGLIAFGLALRARGWRIVYLGTDTPVNMLEQVAHAVQAKVLIVSAARVEPLAPVVSDLESLARRHSLGLGGHGASAAEIHGTSELVLLTGDAISEAERVGRLTQAPA